MGKSSSRFKVAFEDYYMSKRQAGDEQLEENLRYYEELEKEKLKILLMGTSGTGKSTFLRQLRMLHGDMYTEEELVVFISTIHQNLISSMKILLQQAKKLQISGRISSQRSLEVVNRYSGSSSFLNDILLCAISELWSDPVIKSIWNLRGEFVINQSVSMLFDRCDIIATPGYIPEATDILYCCHPTTVGVKTKRCDVFGTMFEMYDIGFRKSSKSEWMQFFTGAKAIIFIVDLTHFDQTSPDDKRKNRMVEALEHFNSACNNPIVRNPSIILLMNKFDLFTQKIRHKRVKDVPVFSDYKGSEICALDGVKYFLKKFESQVKEGEVHHCVTNLLDSDVAGSVIMKCKSVIEARVAEGSASDGQSSAPISPGTLTLNMIALPDKNNFLHTNRSPDPRSCATMNSQFSSAQTSQKTPRSTLRDWDPESHQRLPMGRQQTISTFSRHDD